VFYVASFVADVQGDPVDWLIAKAADMKREDAEKWFAQRGDVYVPVRGSKTAGVEHALVFVAPVISAEPWRVFLTADPLKQGAAFGDDGPITDADEAARLAAAMSKQSGKPYAVFEYTPKAALPNAAVH